MLDEKTNPQKLDAQTAFSNVRFSFFSGGVKKMPVGNNACLRDDKKKNKRRRKMRILFPDNPGEISTHAKGRKGEGGGLPKLSLNYASEKMGGFFLTK